MPPDLRDASYLWDIIDSSRLAIEATAELDFDGYQSNRLVQLAVERCVELIGEAARRLSDEFKVTRPDVPWSWKGASRISGLFESPPEALRSPGSSPERGERQIAAPKSVP